MSRSVAGSKATFSSTINDSSNLVPEKLWALLWTLKNPALVSMSLESKIDPATLDWGDAELDVLAHANDVSGNRRHDLYEVLIDSQPVYFAYMIDSTSQVNLRIVSEMVNSRLVERVVEVLTKGLTPLERTEDSVRVKFWYAASHGPTYTTRTLDVPHWADIRRNYAAKAVDELEALINIRQEDVTGGKLAIMHGPPGTGKTTAIRALAREWQKWCSVDYIIDPERFFGEASYMASVLLASADDNGMYPGINDDDEEEMNRWRLVVIEDAEEFVRPDAKDRVGQSLGRLLNIGDGLVGQGLKTLILLTTNVPLSELHSAITRPGRCMANIEVPELSTVEATDWLGEPHKAATLAELFEYKNKAKIETTIAPVRHGQYL